MLRYVTSFGAVWVGMFAWALLDRRDWAWQTAAGGQWALVLVKLVGAPLVAAWFTLDLLERRRPRLAFDARVRSRAPWVMGLLAGAASVLLAAATLALAQSGLVNVTIDADVLDLAAVGPATAAAVWLSLLPLRRLRPGSCMACGYDLSGSPTATCPECGGVATAG
ncbi:MAG: hypothetical protein IT437_03935 [Phycisphaerales bacterium]|nr:hypothetical protein [Phycisphaerales bacterium]